MEKRWKCLTPMIAAGKLNISDTDLFMVMRIRTILKDRHENILAEFSDYCDKKKVPFRSWADSEKAGGVSDVLKGKEHRLRNFYIDMVAENLEEKHRDFFAQHRKELSRRTIEMLITRISGAI